MRAVLVSCLMGASFALTAHAGPEDFVPGTVITGFGDVAAVEDARLGAETEFHIAYDIAQAAADGEVSRALVTPARFLNMHVAAGVPEENIHLAVVVHGGAYRDLLNADSYGGENPNARLIEQLIAHGVTIELCGQTAAYRDVSENDLLPGVTISLSAMTSQALLQQQGYTLNPF